MTTRSLFPAAYTLDEATTALRQRVRDGLDDGIVCPCCDQLAKRYRRRLNAGMAAALCWLVRRYQADPRWYSPTDEAPRYVVRIAGEFARLRYWGLIESQANDDTAKRCSGLWRPTSYGIAFASRTVAVPPIALVFNGDCHGLTGDPVHIEDCLGTRFDYSELMKGAA